MSPLGYRDEAVAGRVQRQWQVIQGYLWWQQSPAVWLHSNDSTGLGGINFIFQQWHLKQHFLELGPTCVFFFGFANLSQAFLTLSQWNPKPMLAKATYTVPVLVTFPKAGTRPRDCGIQFVIAGKAWCLGCSSNCCMGELVAWLLLVSADQERKIRLEMRLTCNCHVGPPEPCFTS